MGSLAIQPNSKRAYLLALALLAAAIALQWSLRPLVGHRIPFLFFFPAVGIAAMWGGWKPALIVLLGGLVNSLFWLEPVGPLSPDEVAGRVALAGYMVAGGLLVAMGGRMSQLRARAVEAEGIFAAQVKDLEALHAVQSERDAALREASAISNRLHVALETSAVPFCLLQPIADETGGIQGFRWDYLNAAAARVLRRPAAEAVGRPVGEFLVGASTEPGLRGRSVEALRSGTTVQFETWVEAGGNRRWFQVIASPYGEGLAVWFADVTGRKRQEEALRDADRRKDEFLATLAHELRNPLAPIRQAALIAKSPSATEAQKRWSYDVVERQVGHMAMLLEDLLDVSRITRGKLALRKDVIPLRTAVDSALEATRPLVESRRQELEVQLPRESIWLDADPIRVSQVLSNLLTNAAKYTPPEGRITLGAHVEDGMAVIEVADNGIGIAPDAIERIFEMFTQVRSSGNAVAGGLGIGLALSRGLAQLHGGTLAAASRGPGMGSTFSLRLPLAAQPADATGGQPLERRKGRSCRVLVADDNRDAAQTLADLLRMEGHEVAVAFDGTQALAEFGRFEPEVALLDIGMPGLTGNEVASEIRARPEGADTVLVAITGWGQERDRNAAREAGFDFHFTKPVDPLEVLSLLDKAPVRDG